MNSLVIAAVAVAPAVFWLWFFYRRDRYEPEPKLLIIRTFILGMLVAIPIAIIEGILPFSGLVLATVCAPIVEELGKFLVVRRTVYFSSEFDEPMDGIVYAASAALGFATLENMIYIVSTYLTSPLEDVSLSMHSVLFSRFLDMHCSPAYGGMPWVEQSLIRCGSQYLS